MKLVSTNLLTFFIILTISGSLFAQNRGYERKSVTSIGSVLYKKNPSKEVSDIVINRLKAHLEVPRFDYNAVSISSVNKFAMAARKTKFSPTEIALELEKTFIPEITKALNEAAAIRAKESLKEEDIAAKISGRLKDSALESEDIAKVMNSAYLYLPVVTEYDEKTEKSSLQSSIKGYVLWYKVTYDARGAFTGISTVSDTSEVSEGSGSGTISEKYSLKRRKVAGKEYARVIAINTWAKNLAVVMKDIPDFRLSADIKSVNGPLVEAALGKKEGIVLDDGFDLVENYQNEEGEVELKNIGFFRVSEVRDNTGSINANSSFIQYFGTSPQRGMIIMERPRLGIDLTVRPAYFGADILREATGNERIGYIFKDDAKSGYGVDAIFSMNLAKLTNISQFFANVDVRLGMLAVEVDKDVVENISPFILSTYVGAMKKIWFSRLNVNFALAGGVDMLMLRNTGSVDYGDVESINFYAPGIKVDVGLEYLLTADFILGLNAGYKVGLDPFTAEVQYKDSGSETYVGDFGDINFSGLTVSLGLSYALPSLWFDPFSFLTKREIDY
jgi:hypothetical protein